MNDFQVVKEPPSYHILLGRPWIHGHRCVPSTWHQCVKANYKGKDVKMHAAESPFNEDESHLVEVAFYDEAVAVGTNSIVPYQGVSLKN